MILPLIALGFWSLFCGCIGYVLARRTRIPPVTLGDLLDSLQSSAKGWKKLSSDHWGYYSTDGICVGECYHFSIGWSARTGKGVLAHYYQLPDAQSRVEQELSQ